MAAEPEIEIDMMELADIGQPMKLALEIHRQLRAQFDQVPTQLPLASLAKAVGIVGIKEIATDDFEGTLVVQDGFGAIGLRKGLRSGRRNFTIGHEIGHFVIPNHRFGRDKFQCAIVDMGRERSGGNWDSRPPLERIEVEANEFSAALLVPVPEFQKERRRLGTACDIVHIRQLAETFDVSQEMMAKIYVNASDESAAIITSHRGLVRRVIPKSGFPYLGLRRDAPIPATALTSTFRPGGGQSSISDLCEVATHTWLDRKGSVSALYEQVFVQEDGWAMTLLIADEEDSDDEDDDRDWNRRSDRQM
ncbi:ImmA/IrrE family metallo-endopeptidase [Phenylobacterium sp.]|uniref:ImmA/IrrE family metallo-endopeptidase n=1 Tax=Phenylobacterium sp. TaxID=1871053 RepID=UPI002724C4CD|nr:ImmA/IrrE family metallo-endopeptidase [Phenylobacterium sp.]MDO8380999.1 ImmA/IrrE family metallo-endopeptidase [Phenylobacterium sp.]